MNKEVEVYELEYTDEKLLHVQEQGLWMDGPGCSCEYCVLLWTIENGGYYVDYVLNGKKVRLVRKNKK